MYGPGYDAIFAGRMEDCHWTSDLSLAFPARIYSSTIGGTVNLNGTTAGLTLSRAQNILSEFNNVFGATSAAALNIEAMDVN
jgi:hypothetical protein